MDEMSAATPELDAEITPRISRRSTPRTRIEVITRGEPRRSWTIEQKREIVSESLMSGATAADVARKYAISSGQLYTWRHQVLGETTATMVRTVPTFAQVEVAAPAASPAEQPSRASGLIEIVLPGGVTLRVDDRVDARALRRVLGALNGR
jgi:transposase